MSIYILWI